MNTYTSINFFDPQVWRGIMLIGILFASLLAANILKTRIPVLGRLLIPNAVLGGLILLIIAYICQLVTGTNLFNTEVFSDGTGINTLEILTYHCLAIGFIAMTLRPAEKDVGEDRKKRTAAVIDTGIATIGTYMIQAILGIAITVLFSLTVNKDMAPGSGVLLCFGYGQGTGQALNIGKNFDTTLGSGVYASMGLALAATGFLSSCFVGVPYLNLLRKRGLIDPAKEAKSSSRSMEIQSENEVPMNESVDKMSIQIAVVALVYMLAYGMMYLIGNVLLGEGSSMLGTIYGFNFLFGVIAAVIYKAIVNLLKKKGQMHREYLNTFLLNRISGFAFDLMIVSGICAIQINKITGLLGVILLLSVVGAVITFFYQRFVTHRLFPEYEHYQFLAFFGMLTGTASTGMILLREADPDLKTPVSSNMVYQNLPAMVLAIPLLFIAGSLTGNASDLGNTLKMLGIVILIFIVLNIVLFRSLIFSGKKKK